MLHCHGLPASHADQSAQRGNLGGSGIFDNVDVFFDTHDCHQLCTHYAMAKRARKVSKSVPAMANHYSVRHRH
ncbi:hypothetical protein PRK78_005732 [Emydomyces testavorans]|uniref:Uncharacterized protein n=1 Tax=Emydomyces testavorans TaxID=2070801 RepID=A0AAF0DMA2_9EURO|nr:hypothetical protein PRK78_005732 [Emydomyces testavorans]